MNVYHLKISRTAFFSQLLQMLCFFMLIIAANGRLRENIADLSVSCDDSAMNVQMNFKYPFNGIVFIPEHYYDPICSFSVPPNSTALQITLTLPHESCKMRVLNSAKKLIGMNAIVIFHHRMLETVYDYTQNITCELEYPIKDLNANIWREPVFKSWLTFENSASILPEHIVDKFDLEEDALLLVYHVRDRGVHRDMVVMNCIGHDSIIINEKTRFYHISNPYGCSAESDIVSNFTIFRNPVGMIAFATIKNFTMVIRRRLYITCGAQICRDRCERKCGEHDQQRSFYFTDIVTKGLVNRPEGSKRPASLTVFERFDRQRRSEKNSSDSQNTVNEFLLGKMNVSQYPVNSDSATNQKINFDSATNQKINSDSTTNQKINFDSSTNWTEINNTSPLFESVEQIRSKRAIKQLKTILAPVGMNVIVIKSVENLNSKSPTVNIQSSSKNEMTGDVYANSSEVCETESILKVKMSFEPTPSSKIHGEETSEEFTFTSFLRAVVAIFALICISGAFYSLCSFRRADTSVSDYVSQSYM